MASFSVATLTFTSSSSSSSSPLFYLSDHFSASCPSVISFYRCFGAFPTNVGAAHHRRENSGLTIKAQTLDFSGSFFEDGFRGDDDSSSRPGSIISVVEDKEEPQCSPGLRQYETMAVFGPDMSEDDRLSLTQKYEELEAMGFDLALVLDICFACNKNEDMNEFVD